MRYLRDTLGTWQGKPQTDGELDLLRTARLSTSRGQQSGDRCHLSIGASPRR